MSNKKNTTAARKTPSPEHAAEVEAMIARLRRGRQVWRDVRWPGGEMMVRMRVLSSSEMQLALADAFKRFEELELPVNSITLEELTMEKVTQVLWRACGNPERPTPGYSGRWDPAFRTVEVFRDATHPEERAAVFVDYVQLKDDADPSPDLILDPEVIEDIEEALKKKSVVHLASCGSWPLAIYMLTTGRPSSISPMDRSWSGPSSEGSTTGSDHENETSEASEPQ
jgi:hypothetical protein